MVFTKDDLAVMGYMFHWKRWTGSLSLLDYSTWSILQELVYEGRRESFANLRDLQNVIRDKWHDDDQTMKQVAQLWQRDRASSINHFRWGGGSIWGYYRLRSYFWRHCDTTQFTLTDHMVNKPFLLLGLAAEYRSRHRRRWWHDARTTLPPTIRCL